MSRNIKHYIFNQKGLGDDYFENIVRQLMEQKVVSFYQKDGKVIFGRYGTNKTTLKELLSIHQRNAKKWVW